MLEFNNSRIIKNSPLKNIVKTKSNLLTSFIYSKLTFIFYYNLNLLINLLIVFLIYANVSYLSYKYHIKKYSKISI